MIREVRDLVTSAVLWRAHNGVPGVVAGVVQGQELTWTFADGQADPVGGVAIRADGLFRIGSITKTFVAASILQLRDECALELDDPLVLHLPHAHAVRNPFGQIQDVTLRDMLQHTAGLPREVPVLGVNDHIALADEEFLTALNGMELVRPPRTAHQYSNVAYRLLGYVIEAVSGQKFADYVATHISEPLGMSETTAAPSGDLANRVVPGHWARDASGTVQPHTPMEPERTGGESALYSTLGDLACWLAQQLRTGAEIRRGPGQILNGASLIDMHRPHVLADCTWTTAWGLGWSTVNKPGGCRFHGHNGSFAGHQAYAGFCSDHQHGAIVLTNGHTTTRPAVELCGELLQATREAAATTFQLPRVAQTRDWSDYPGTYRWPQLGATVRIHVESSHLVCTDARTSLVLVESPDEADAFRLVTGAQSGERVRFFRGDLDRINAVNVAGYTYHRLDEEEA